MAPTAEQTAAAADETSTSEKASPTTPIFPDPIPKLTALATAAAGVNTKTNGTTSKSSTANVSAMPNPNGNDTANAVPNGNGAARRASKSSVLTYDVTCVLSHNSLPQRFRAATWKLLAWDLFFLLKNTAMLPHIFLPLGPLGMDIGILGIIGQTVMIPLSLLLTAWVVLSVFISSPIIPIVLIILFSKVADYLQGDLTRTSNSGIEILPETGTEAWFSVNGIGTTGEGAQLIADRLEKLFHRRVTAVLNRSLGAWFDLVECILQRDLLITTADIREGYRHIRAAVKDPKKKRVVIVGHSQGGIIVSAWADQLICDFPEEILAKVEIYTFASAANHFSRPTSKDLDFPFLRTTSTAPFGCVEHFANEGDFVSQFGVLGNAPAAPPDLVPGAPIPVLNGYFGGRIFLRRGHTGHLFNAHYVNPADSILDDPEVRRHSNLVTYLDGQRIAK